MKKNKLTVYQMCTTAIMTALFCVLGPLSIPVGAVPVSLTMVVVFLADYVIGPKYGTISYLLYLVLGTIGVPVFSGFQGGPAKIAGPTGGYLIGFILMSVLVGIVINRFDAKPIPCALGMAVGLAVSYVLGTIWFIIESGYELQAALAVCVYPFLIFDAIKIIFCACVGPLIRSQLKKAHLI